MKKFILIVGLCLSPFCFAAMSQDVVVSGYVTKILDKTVVLYVDGRLMDLPKHLLKKRVKMGEEISVSLTLAQMRKLAKSGTRIPAARKVKK